MKSNNDPRLRILRISFAGYLCQVLFGDKLGIGENKTMRETINSITKSVDTTINRKIKLYLVLIILQIGTVMYVQAQSKYDSIDISINAFMAEKKIPGFAACIVKDGSDNLVKIVWTSGYSE